MAAQLTQTQHQHQHHGMTKVGKGQLCSDGKQRIYALLDHCPFADEPIDADLRFLFKIVVYLWIRLV